MGTSSHTMAVQAPPRTLHLVDLENLTRGPGASRAVALAVFTRYLQVAGWSEGDQVLLASSGLLMGKVAFDLASWASPVPASIHAADGPDGADLLLLALAPASLVIERYDRLVIGSGDGIFGDRACAVRDAGIEVAVVAPRGGCSYRLWGFGPTLIDPDEMVLAA